MRAEPGNDRSGGAARAGWFGRPASGARCGGRAGRAAGRPLRDYISQGRLRRRGPGAARPARGMLGRGLQNGQPQGCARYGPARAAPAAPGSVPALPGLCPLLPPRCHPPARPQRPRGSGSRGWGCAPGVGVCRQSRGLAEAPPLNSLLLSRSGAEPGVRHGSPRSFLAHFPLGKPGCWFGMAPLLISPRFPAGKPSQGSGVVSPLFFLLFSPREIEPVVRGGPTDDFSSPFPTGNPTVHSLSFPVGKLSWWFVETPLLIFWVFFSYFFFYRGAVFGMIPQFIPSLFPQGEQALFWDDARVKLFSCRKYEP